MNQYDHIKHVQTSDGLNLININTRSHQFLEKKSLPGQTFDIDQDLILRPFQLLTQK
eukprot:m.283902 g.283902  ORF g.283902 m.283902 type:complete len:57 (+) comp22906_c11_seq16:85-255(+)